MKTENCSHFTDAGLRPHYSSGHDFQNRARLRFCDHFELCFYPVRDLIWVAKLTDKKILSRTGQNHVVSIPFSTHIWCLWHYFKGQFYPIWRLSATSRQFGISWVLLLKSEIFCPCEGRRLHVNTELQPRGVVAFVSALRYNKPTPWRWKPVKANALI